MEVVEEYGLLHPVFRKAKASNDGVSDGTRLKLIARTMSKLNQQPKYQLRRHNRGRIVAEPSRYYRRVTVQSHIVKNYNKKTFAKFRQHINYIQRDGAGLEGNRPELFSEETITDKGKSFINRSQEDPRQFRFMVSPEDADHIDFHDFTQRFMEQVEKDLNTKLDWIASVHHNTNHPHAHIVVRGLDKEGKELFISRDYIARGMRYRASQMLTQELGKRSDIELENELKNAVTSERFCGLDRSIEKLKNAGNTVTIISSEISYEIQRLEHLYSQELAEKICDNTWKIVDNLKEILHERAIQGDIVKMLHRDQRFEYETIRRFDPRSDNSLSGTVIKSGLKSELKQERFIVINDESGTKHYVEIGSKFISNAPRVGDRVEVSVKRPDDIEQSKGRYRPKVSVKITERARHNEHKNERGIGD